MRNSSHQRIETPTTHSLRQRIVACFLLVLVLFLIVNPIWECHDHLDNLRHLGSHGILIILLLVACAGLSLLKSLRWLSWNLLCSILLGCKARAVVRLAVQKPFCALVPDLPLPLRI